VLTRVAYKPYTFSDGTHIPAGTFVTVPLMAHQIDARNYDNALETQPFRFEAVDDDATRKYFTTSDPRYIAFGLGGIIPSFHRRNSVLWLTRRQESMHVQDASSLETS
jgi:cytochrome P450